MASVRRPTAFENFEIARSSFSFVNNLSCFQDQIPEVRFDVGQVNDIDGVQANRIVDCLMDPVPFPPAWVCRPRDRSPNPECVGLPREIRTIQSAWDPVLF